jgi:hypothetical protein
VAACSFLCRQPQASSWQRVSLQGAAQLTDRQHLLDEAPCAELSSALESPPLPLLLLQTLARENRREYGRLLLELWVNQVHAGRAER